MTVLKQADDKQPLLDALGSVLARPDLDARTRKKVEDEIWAVRTGAKGERDAAYEIEFHYGRRDSYVVIHDLRLEIDGRVAQIDHLILNRVLDVWVCETKAFSEGVKINEKGEWFRYGGRFAHGMASPVLQNRRHIEVLRDLFENGSVRLPRRLVTLKPTLHPVVLISNDARVDRPKSRAARASVEGLETVIKVEQLERTIDRSFDERNPFRLLPKIVSVETISQLGRQLVALHRPAPIDVAGRFGLGPEAVSPSTQPAAAPASAAERCASCDKPVSPKVAAYSRDHADLFGGRVLCFDCQRRTRRVTA